MSQFFDPDGPWYSLTSRSDAPLLFSLIAGLASVAITVAITWFAYRLARRIEQRRLVLEFLKELNSDEMIRDRFHAVEAIQKFSDAKTGKAEFENKTWAYMIDAVNLDWYPGCGFEHFDRLQNTADPSKPAPRPMGQKVTRNLNEFKEAHGLSNLIYLVSRVQYCLDHDLLDEQLARAFLYAWFLYYLPFLEHFSAAVRERVDKSTVDKQVEPAWLRSLEKAVEEMRKIALRGGGAKKLAAPIAKP
jgi:hypothetical protein